MTPKECADRAKALQADGSCSFFMHSDDYPVEGCYCCELYEPVADTKYNYSIYQTCQEDSKSTGKYQKCINDVNLSQHNSLRKKHGADVKTELLKIDKTLAEGATKRAEALQNIGQTSADQAWLTTDGKLCGESVVRFDALSAPGLTPENWKVGSLVSDYFYKGSIEYDHDTHQASGPRGIEYAQMLWR